MITLDGAANICLSGGAIGADLQWGMTAGMLGHKVIHWSFQGHRTEAPQDEVVILSDEQLREADPHLERANFSLYRKLPYNKPGIINLLRRNWFQVAYTESVYAVSTFKSHKVQGGTAWAVQMFLDRHDGKECPVYVFDQERSVWARWTGSEWLALEGDPPVPTGIWTGIGTRDLNFYGKEAIRHLMGYKPNAFIVQA